MKKKDDVTAKKKFGDRGELFSKKKSEGRKNILVVIQKILHTQSHTHKYVHTGTHFLFFFLLKLNKKEHTHTL